MGDGDLYYILYAMQTELKGVSGGLSEISYPKVHPWGVLTHPLTRSPAHLLNSTYRAETTNQPPKSFNDICSSSSFQYMAYQTLYLLENCVFKMK